MVTIHFFAGLKRFFPTAVELEILEGTDAQAVINQLKQRCPDAANQLDACRIAINEEFVEPTTPIKPNMQLFLIPPSSGG